MSGGPAWAAYPLKSLRICDHPFFTKEEEEERETNIPPEGDPNYYPDGDWLKVRDIGVFAVTLGIDEVFRLTFIPSSQLTTELRERGVFEPTKKGGGASSVALPDYPFLISISWDGHWIAVSYQNTNDAGKVESSRIDIYKLNDIRAKVTKPFASKGLNHDIRVLKWTKIGAHRLMIGGTRHMSLLLENHSLTEPRPLQADLGSADWSPEKDDVIAVAYLGTAMDPPPLTALDPSFAEEGEVVLELALNGDVLKNLPSNIRGSADEENIDEIEAEFRADRHNVMHLAWLTNDLLVGVNRRGDIGLLKIASAPAAGFEVSGLPPLFPSPTRESRLFAALLRQSSSNGGLPAVNFLFWASSLEQYIHTADLTKDFVPDPSQKVGQPRVRPLEPAGTLEGIPLALLEEEAGRDVPFKQRCCGLGLLLVKTGLGQQSYDTTKYRPVIVAMGVGGHLFLFALQDGSNMQAEQTLLKETPIEPVVTPAAAPAPVKVPSLTTASVFGGQAKALPPLPAIPSITSTPSIFAAPPNGLSATAPASAGSSGLFGGMASSTTTKASPFSFSGGPTAAALGGGASGQGQQTKAFSSTFGGASSTSSAFGAASIGPAKTSTTAPISTSSSFSFKSERPSQQHQQQQQEQKPSIFGAKPSQALPPSSLAGAKQEEQQRGKATAAAAPLPAPPKAAQLALPDSSDEEEDGPELEEQVAGHDLALDEAADKEDALLAAKRLESLPPTLPSSSAAASRHAAAAFSASTETPDQVIQEVLNLAEYKRPGDEDIASKLVAIKDPEQRKIKAENIKNLKSLAMELLDRVELFEAEVSALDDRTKTLYGKQLELARNLRQVTLVIEQEEARRAEKGGESKNGGREWEADFLDAFACVERETLVDDVEKLAHAIGRMLARGPQKAAAASASSSFQSPTSSMRSPGFDRSKGYRQSLRERHGQLRGGGSAVKDWLGSQAEAQLCEDVARELRAVWREKVAVWNLLADDPEKGFRLEKYRAQRRQRDRWSSPEGGNGIKQQKRPSGRYGVSSLALLDDSDDEEGDSEVMNGVAKRMPNGRSKGTLQEARRVAVLLGRVKEELTVEEEVEIQGAEAGESERAKKDLAALRRKRDERIQENKRKTAQVRTAATSTAAAPPPAHPKPTSVSHQQQAKAPSTGPSSGGGAAGGGGEGGGGNLMPWAQAAAKSVPSTVFGGGGEKAAWPSTTGQALGGMGGAGARSGFSFGNSVASAPPSSSQAAGSSESEKVPSEAKPLGPAPAKSMGVGVAPLAPMPTKAPPVFNPAAAAAGGSKPSSTVSSLGTLSTRGGGLTRQPSSNNFGGTVAQSAKPPASASASGGSSSLGTSAIPPMSAVAPKPFQPPPAVSTPVKGPAPTAGAAGFTAPTTISSSSAACGSGGGAKATAASAPVPPMPTQAPSKNGFSFGNMTLGGGGGAGAQAKEPPKPSLFSSTSGIGGKASSSAMPSLGGMTLGGSKSTPTTRAPEPAAMGGGSWPVSSSSSMGGGATTATTTGRGGGGGAGASLFGSNATPLAVPIPTKPSGGRVFGSMSLAPNTGAPSSMSTPTGGSSLFGGNTQQPQAQTGGSAGSSVFGGQAFGNKPASTAGGMTTGFGVLSGMSQQQQQQPQQQQGGGFGGGAMGGGGAGMLPPGGGPEAMRRFYARYEPNKAGQADALWQKYQTKPADMWHKMFAKYKVPENERRDYFPEYGTPQGQPQQSPLQPQQLNQSPLTSTSTSAQFGRAGSGLGTGRGFGMSTPPQSQPSGFSSFAAKPSPFGSGAGVGSGGGFGQAPQHSIGFGKPAGQAPQQTGFGGGFGAPQTPQQPPLFGTPQQQQQQQQQGGGFGSPFGQQVQQQPPQGTNLFGQPSQPNTGFGWPSG